MQHCELTELAKKYNCDKWGAHRYTPHYHRFFEKFRYSKINLLEIGVGGYDDPCRGGESLCMWEEYFPNAKIVAIDIYPKEVCQKERIKIYQGSQIDKNLLQIINNNDGPFDIIIDDGSHMNQHIIKSFDMLFPMLKDQGVYVVEDLQTSYWNYYGGDSFNLKNKKTAINYFRKLVHSLNYEEIDNPSYQPTYYDKNIIGIHFYHNMVFVEKGNNQEGSNVVVNNKLPDKSYVRSKLKYFVRKTLSLFS